MGGLEWIGMDLNGFEWIGIGWNVHAGLQLSHSMRNCVKQISSTVTRSESLKNGVFLMIFEMVKNCIFGHLFFIFFHDLIDFSRTFLESLKRDCPLNLFLSAPAPVNEKVIAVKVVSLKVVTLKGVIEPGNLFID